MITTFERKNAPIEKIKQWLNESILDSKHYENYLNLDINENYLAITLEEVDNKFCTFSSIYTRDFYPKNCYRIFNRYFVHPDYRVELQRKGIEKFPILSNRTLTIINQQIEFCKLMSADCAFITLHSYKPGWCRQFVKELNENTKYNWNLEDLVLVAPDKMNKKCYQHVIYSYINSKKSMKDFLKQKITLDDWKKIC